MTAVSQGLRPCQRSRAALWSGLLAEAASGSGSGFGEVNSFKMFRVFVGLEGSRLSPHACQTFPVPFVAKYVFPTPAIESHRVKKKSVFFTKVLFG